MISALIDVVNFSLLILGGTALFISSPISGIDDGESFWKKQGKYGFTINLMALPLMILQIFLSIGSIFASFLVAEIITLILMLFTWVLTFDFALPIQGQVFDNGIERKNLRELNKINLLRTTCWSLIFVIGLMA